MKKRILVASVIFLVFLALWEAAARSGLWSPLLLPAPSAVAQYIVGAIQDGTLLTAVTVTMKRLFFGYFLGLVLGLPLGLLTARFRLAHDTLGVLALGMQTLPSVCWVPLAYQWFKGGESGMLFIVVMGTVWAVLLATAHGIQQIPPLYRKAAATMGSSGLHLWCKVLLPASLPHIVSGTKQGWAFAWRSLMAAEISVSVIGSLGLGNVLNYGRDLNAMDQVVGLMVVIVVIGFAADKLIFSPWESFLHRRWGLGG